MSGMAVHKVLNVCPYFADSVYMRISDGLSIFSMPTAGSVRERAGIMVWPVYNDSRIMPAKGVTRHLENPIPFIKPTPDEHARAASLIDAPQPLYARNAHIHKNMQIAIPGTFFDAIA